MKILVTGARGFIGKNLIAELKNQGYTEILEYDLDSGKDTLDAHCRDANFVLHLAGVNRPENNEAFMQGNFGFTSILLETLKKYQNTCPVMLSSSTQASRDNPYGQSKKAGEDLLFYYGKETGAKVLIYRFPNVFGKWCRPNYNSAIATFCHNIAHDLPIQINDPKVDMQLIYIDDLVGELINAVKGNENKVGDYCEIPVVHNVKLGDIVESLTQFKKNRQDLRIPNMEDPFIKKLYSTYLSYLPKDQFNYPLKMNIDQRGSFTEFIRTPDRGQVSVNISKPGITKGNHWHNTKNEKFLVVKGQGLIRFRKIDEDDIIDYHVTGGKMEVIDIPTGYTHNIQNLGDEDMITIMWANEGFDPEKPDTYYLEV